MRAHQDTGLGPGITSEAVFEICEYARMIRLESVVLVGSIGGVLTELVVGSGEHRTVLPHLRMF